MKESTVAEKEFRRVPGLFSEELDEIIKHIEQLRDRESSPVMVAIDGKAAAGKTTLAEYLHTALDSNLFHMDDFFLRPEQRTEKRLKEIGGNVDYERFGEEVITPLLAGQAVMYRPYSCRDKRVMDAVEIEYKQVNIIEGAYSMHPHFGDIYEIRILLNITEDEQAERIRRRNGEELLARFISEWIPKENAYLEKYKIFKKAVCLISKNE